MGIGDFIQNQILRMKWLESLIHSLLTSLGLDTTARIGGSIQFFLYHQLYPELFPAGEKQENHGQIPRHRSEHCGCVAWHRNAILLMLVHSYFHWLHQRGTAAGSDVFIPDFISNGRSRKPCSADEYLRCENRFRVCDCRTRYRCDWRYDHRETSSGK